MGVKLVLRTLKEKPRLRVLKSRVVRVTFGPKMDEVTGDVRKLHVEELNGLDCSPKITRVIESRRMRWAGHVACVVERTGVYRV